MEKILTAGQAAAYLGVCLSTLRSIDKHLQPFRTPRGHRRYNLQVLDEYLGNERHESFPNGGSLLLTASEASKYLGVSKVTLGKIESEGYLTPYRTPGGHRRYSLQMLDEYLEKSKELFNNMAR